MVAFRLNPEMLVHTRFAFSPIAEVGAALHLLADPPAGTIHRRWLELAHEAAADMDLSLLTALAPRGTLLPSFLYRPASSPQTTIETQLVELEQGGIEPVAAELEEIWGTRPMPAPLADILDRGDLGLRTLTDALRTFWQRTVEPYWPSIRAVLEDDVAHRGGQIVGGGIYDLFLDIHPEASVDGELLRIHKPHLQDANTTYASTRLTLVPSVFTYPKLVIDHDEAGHVVLIYGARGVGKTWEGLNRPVARDDTHHLATLIGRTRAAILLRLDVPMTTSQLAAELGQSNATVSEHLTCLRSAGLLVSRRNGRRVYYRQTPLAASLIDACRPGTLGAAQ